jgi:hypothetical protein
MDLNSSKLICPSPSTSASSIIVLICEGNSKIIYYQVCRTRYWLDYAPHGKTSETRKPIEKVWWLDYASRGKTSETRKPIEKVWANA